jgi:hypothetical protein
MPPNRKGVKMARTKIDDGVKTTLLIRRDIHNTMQKYCLKNEISMASFMRSCIYIEVRKIMDDMKRSKK